MSHRTDQHDRVAAARARVAQLREPGAVASLRREIEQRVVSWRSYDRGTTLHRPEPYLGERMGEEARRWLATGEQGSRAICCGFDAEGRVVIARGPLHGGVDEHLIIPGEAGDVLVAMRWDDDERHSPYVTLIYRDSRGRVEATAEDTGWSTEYVYGNGLPLRALTIGPQSDEPTVVTTFEHDDSGRLCRVVENADGKTRVVWDERTHAAEYGLPSFDAIVEGLADPLSRALAAGVAEAVGQFHGDLLVVARFDGRSPSPSIVVVAERLLVRLRTDAESVGELVNRISDAAGDPAVSEAQRIDPLERLDPHAQRALRQFRQRGELWPVPGGHYTDQHRAALTTYAETILLLNGPSRVSPVPVIAWIDSKELDGLTLPGLAISPQLRRRVDDDWLLTVATAGESTAALLRGRLVGNA